MFNIPYIDFEKEEQNSDINIKQIDFTEPEMRFGVTESNTQMFDIYYIDFGKEEQHSDINIKLINLEKQIYFAKHTDFFPTQLNKPIKKSKNIVNTLIPTMKSIGTIFQNRVKLNQNEAKGIRTRGIGMKIF